jgi:GT2 family glycosyltransferase
VEELYNVDIKNSPLSVSICILTYNRCARLRELLEKIGGLTCASIEIIVIDNHSEDKTREMMISDFPYVKYLRTERNIGASARNIAMKAAKGDIIVTLDDDVMGLNGRGLEELVRKFSEDPTVGAVNFRVKNSEGSVCNWVHHCRHEDFADKEFQTYEITEGAVAFRRKVLEYSGYYPETFFLSHEGPDLAFRIIESGFKVIYIPNVEVMHCFATEGREPWRNYYFDTRNQLWLAVRNFPVIYALVYLGRGLLSMLVYSVRDGYFYYWLKAVVDGIAGLKQVLGERSVLSVATMKSIKMIDSQRPSLVYMIKDRLLVKDSVNLK